MSRRLCRRHDNGTCTWVATVIYQHNRTRSPTTSASPLHLDQVTLLDWLRCRHKAVQVIRYHSHTFVGTFYTGCSGNWTPVTYFIITCVHFLHVHVRVIAKFDTSRGKESHPILREDIQGAVTRTLLVPIKWLLCNRSMDIKIWYMYVTNWPTLEQM